MVGKTLGHYKILEPLGAGGMGEVYRARDTKLDRDVALKVLPDEFSQDRDRLARFKLEAKAVAALDHPNVVTLYSVEESDGTHFLTMQLVEGKNLSALIRGDGLPLDRFFELAIPLTEAIGAAHRQGITHRDLKPSNVMVGADGRVRVLDFGLAKLLADPTADGATELPTEQLTEEGHILGTVAYMSPEQAEGKSIDHRSDIFSLGILLYEMATGQRPFHGETRVSTITSILRDEPPSVSDFKHDAPRHLGRIIKRSLAKDPDRRYQTALDLRNELEALQEELVGAPVGIAPIGMPGDAGAVSDPVVSGAAPSTAQRAPVPSDSGDLSSDTAVLVDLIRRRRSFLATAGVLGAAIVGVFWMLRGTETVSADRRLQHLTSLEGQEWDMSWSPDGGMFAFSHTSRGNSDISVRSTGGGASVDLTASPRDEVRPRWSPDNNWVAYLMDPGTGSTVYLVPPLGGEPRELTNTEIPWLERAADAFASIGASPWSPDGQLFLFSRLDESSGNIAVHQINVETRREVQLTRPSAGTDDLSASWSPDGRQIVFHRRQAGSREELWLMGADGGEAYAFFEEELPMGSPQSTMRWPISEPRMGNPSSRTDGLPSRWIFC